MSTRVDDLKRFPAIDRVAGKLERGAFSPATAADESDLRLLLEEAADELRQLVEAATCLRAELAAERSRAARAREEALEAAARECELEDEEAEPFQKGGLAIRCACAIRNLKGG